MADLFEKIVLLKESDIFKEIDTDDLRLVADVLEEEHFFSNDVIFEINDQGELVVKDTFDFNDKKDIKSLEDLKFALINMKDAFLGKEGFAGTGGLYSLIREGARYVGSGPGEGAPVEINLGKYKSI